MYSPLIVERAQHRVEKDLNLKLHRYDFDDSLHLSSSIEKLVDPRTGKQIRQLTPGEQQFVKNELTLSAIDFRYWIRYCTIEIDGGGSGPLRLKESQDIALNRYIAPAEEMMHQQRDEQQAMGIPDNQIVVDGIRFYWHKARQLYATTTARAMLFHRLLFNTDIRGMTRGSSGTTILQSRIAYNRLYGEIDAALKRGEKVWLTVETAAAEGVEQ